MHKKTKWKIKHQGSWYPLINIVDSGKPSHEDGGGNHYHVEGHDPIHQDDIEDIDMGYGSKDVSKADKIPGGLADKKKTSDFDSKKLKAGIKIEMEHTSDRSIAQEIAMDHLTEDSEYYKKLKEVEKYDRVEVAPDGKRELDYGKEDLNKEPDIKKRWSKLKKALDSSTAIIDLLAAEGGDEDQGDQSEQQPQPAADTAEQPQPAEAAQSPQAAPPQDDGSQTPEDGQDQQQQTDQEVIDFLREEGYEDSEIAYIIHNHSMPIPTKDDHAAQNEAAKGEARLAQMQDDHDLQQGHAKEAHQQERRQDEDEHKHTLEHKKRMGDVEYEKAKADLVDPALAGEHKKKMLSMEYGIAALEVEHKKRMLDLEYQKAHKEANKEDPTDAINKEQMRFELQMKRLEKESEFETNKKQAELEFQYKEKELKLNLKLKEEAAKLKSKMQEEQMKNDHEVNTQVRAEQAKHKIAESKKLPKKDGNK